MDSLGQSSHASLMPRSSQKKVPAQRLTVPSSMHPLSVSSEQHHASMPLDPADFHRDTLHKDIFHHGYRERERVSRGSHQSGGRDVTSASVDGQPWTPIGALLEQRSPEGREHCFLPRSRGKCCSPLGVPVGVLLLSSVLPATMGLGISASKLHHGVPAISAAWVPPRHAPRTHHQQAAAASCSITVPHLPSARKDRALQNGVFGVRAQQIPQDDARAIEPSKVCLYAPGSC